GDGAWANLVLPALTLGAIHTGTIARMTRSSLLEVVRQEYIQAARAKGLAEWRVVAKHALRNALIPVVTVIGIGLADLLVGAPLTETVFAWPGLGRMLVGAVGQRDLPVALGGVLGVRCDLRSRQPSGRSRLSGHRPEDPSCPLTRCRLPGWREGRKQAPGAGASWSAGRSSARSRSPRCWPRGSPLTIRPR